MINDDQLEVLFAYCPPTPQQRVNYAEIRQAARGFSNVIRDQTPAGADQTAALLKLRECVMTANAAIAYNREP